MCLGDRQIHTKCFITEQPDSVLMGLNWLDDAPESVTRINSKTKADPQPINTKKDIIKGGRTKKKVNHQTPMVENVIADRDIEMEITSILSDSTRNILATCSRNTSLVSERLCHLVTNELRTTKMTCATDSMRITGPIQQSIDPICCCSLSDI